MVEICRQDMATIKSSSMDIKQTDNSLRMVLMEGEKARLTINGILIIT